jgi:hypothetical protein
MSNTKTITATAQGLNIYYERTQHLTTVKYDKALYQNQRNNPVNRFGGLHLNPIQRTMFRRIMYGLGDFTPAQIQEMDKNTRQAIDTDHKRAKAAIDKMKYDLTYAPVDKLFNAIFPHVKIGTKQYDFHVSLPSLRELRIGTKEVCETLIQAGLLPQNFFSINTESLAL